MGSLCSSHTEREPEAIELNQNPERIGAARTRARQEQQEAKQKANFQVVEEPNRDAISLAIVKEQAVQALAFAEIWKEETERVVGPEELNRIKAATLLRLAGELPSVPRPAKTES